LLKLNVTEISKYRSIKSFQVLKHIKLSNLFTAAFGIKPPPLSPASQPEMEKLILEDLDTVPACVKVRKNEDL
jgi:hypothetical protein